MTRQAAVIKPGVAGRNAGLGLRTFRIDDVLREAREAAARARAEAERILAAVRAEAEQIRDRAREAGHLEGLEDGRRAGVERGRAEALEAAKREYREQLGSALAACEQLITELNRHRLRWEVQARSDLIELAMAIARRVCWHVGRRDREVVLANLEEAVKLAGARNDVTIMVNPADAATAGLFAKSLTDLQEQWAHVRVAEDLEVAPGGCRVQWGGGAVDATLETQLERIEAALHGGAEDGETERQRARKHQGPGTTDN